MIDSFVYAAIGTWKWLSPGEESTANSGDYETALLNYLKQNTIQLPPYLRAPGSNQQVDLSQSLGGLVRVLIYITE